MIDLHDEDAAWYGVGEPPVGGDEGRADLVCHCDIGGVIGAEPPFKSMAERRQRNLARRHRSEERRVGKECRL